MNTLKQYMEECPATLTITMTFLSVALLFLAKIFEPDPVPLFNLPRLFLLAGISAAVFKILKHCNWTESAGLTKPLSSWHPRWFLATIPLQLIAFLSFTSVNWTEIQFSTHAVSAWILSNFATGFFEEVLMRGLCFYILVKAWGATKKGVFLAAIFQAVIFGLAHLGNLYNMPALDVFAQVVFATLIGVGFAGLVYLTKSLWPAIIVHSLINAIGTINDYLVPGTGEFQSPGLAGYIVIIVIFFVLSTIPGLLYIKSSKPYFSQAHD
ncbi:CPBP family intramembrane glutamic endopeptidase [Aliikangiella coralliicola]|uniref:CPBP family intramembrane metalloprotease n=1 Tax=Aliikangiella coralliicola TaxID=2592383 RepID=A0A545U7G2_9GAMM|nr:CPBP family intramembrane glutamic endopeptidase [Aliikangiella coralliicola]TQV85408.1 CPBP family intramembrane metalloprotease [Aliikangiella coralliicola]